MELDQHISMEVVMRRTCFIANEKNGSSLKVNRRKCSEFMCFSFHVGLIILKKEYQNFLLIMTRRNGLEK